MSVPVRTTFLEQLEIQFNGWQMQLKFDNGLSYGHFSYATNLLLMITSGGYIKRFNENLSSMGSRSDSLSRFE